MAHKEETYQRAWLGLGGNIGKVEDNFRLAVRFLTEPGDTRLLAASSLYRSKAWGVESQPDFLNACLLVQTLRPPRALLALCAQAEQAAKRQRAEKWGPRSLDIDILLYEGAETDGKDKSLILPHPFLAERAFVVLPLAEIDPHLLFMGQSMGERAAQMLREGQGGNIKKLEKSEYWFKL